MLSYFTWLLINSDKSTQGEVQSVSSACRDETVLLLFWISCWNTAASSASERCDTWNMEPKASAANSKNEKQAGLWSRDASEGAAIWKRFQSCTFSSNIWTYNRAIIPFSLFFFFLQRRMVGCRSRVPMGFLKNGAAAKKTIHVWWPVWSKWHKWLIKLDGMKSVQNSFVTGRTLNVFLLKCWRPLWWSAGSP